jgi:hypothetical protein
MIQIIIRTTRHEWGKGLLAPNTRCNNAHRSCYEDYPNGNMMILTLFVQRLKHDFPTDLVEDKRTAMRTVYLVPHDHHILKTDSKLKMDKLRVERIFLIN